MLHRPIPTARKTMIQSLQDAFNRAADLPPEEQERFAKFVLAELDADQEWSRLFEHPESDEMLDRLANEALSAHKEGRTTLLNPESL